MTQKIRIAIAVALACSILTGCSKSPESTIESFYKSLGKGEITEAKTYLSSQITNMLGDAKVTSALTREATKINACGGIKSVDSKLQGEGEIRTGSVVITFVSDSCQPNSSKAKLIKEDGKWKVAPSK